MLYHLSFKTNPDLIVEAHNEEHAKEVAKQIHDFEGVTTSDVTKIIIVNTLLRNSHAQLYGIF